MRWKTGSAIFFTLLLTTVIMMASGGSDGETDDALIRSVIEVEASIHDHYAVTDVWMTFNNPGTEGGDLTFLYTIPLDSLLSNITLEQDGMVYFADVVRTQEASQRYDNATRENKTATKIESTADPHIFRVSLNVKPSGQVRITLRHESVILRTLGEYTYSFDLGAIPGYTDFEECRGNVSIRSVSNITNLMTEASTLDMTEAWSGKGSVDLSFQTGDPSSGEKVNVVFKEERRPGAGMLSTFQEGSDGYFMHLFTPELEEMGTHLPKDIVFVLDQSGSMSGTKIAQLKDAFGSIVQQLYEGDSFDMVIFSSVTTKYKQEMQPVTHDSKDSAEAYIDAIQAGGSTTINQALLDALDLLDENEGAIPIVVFLTDGLPTEGTTNTDTIRDNVKVANDGLGASVYTLGFGEDVDFEFLKALALENEGTATKIPASAQASSLLTGFYDTISIPLLMDIRFSYGSATFDVLPDRTPQDLGPQDDLGHDGPDHSRGRDRRAEGERHFPGPGVLVRDKVHIVHPRGRGKGTGPPGGSSGTGGSPGPIL